MTTGNDSTTAGTWADELIDDDYTGVSTKHLWYRNSPEYSSDQPEQQHPSQLLLKHFSLHQNDHFVCGVLSGFQYDPEKNRCTAEITDEDSLKIFSEIYSYLPLELMDCLSCLKMNIEDILKQSLKVAEDLIKKDQNNDLNERKTIQLTTGNLDDYPRTRDRLKELESKLSLGFSCVLCVIAPKKIYISNIGNTRAIICRKTFDLDGNANGQIQAEEVSVIHDWCNPDEILRLESIGIHTENIGEKNKMATGNLTRCLGNFLVKTSNAEFFDISDEHDSPILCEPTIDSFQTDGSLLFLILASASLIELCEKAMENKNNVIDDLIQMINQKLTMKNIKEVPDQIVNELYEMYRKIHGKLPEPSSTPILLLRDLSFHDQQQQTIYNSGQTADDDAYRTLTASNYDSMSNSVSYREPEEEIEPYVEFTPEFLESLQKLDYDKLLSSA